MAYVASRPWTFLVLSQNSPTTSRSGVVDRSTERLGEPGLAAGGVAVVGAGGRRSHVPPPDLGQDVLVPRRAQPSRRISTPRGGSPPRFGALDRGRSRDQTRGAPAHEPTPFQAARNSSRP